MILVVIVLTLFIHYPPFEEEQPIVIRKGMTLRHIAERNNVPVQSLMSLLSPDEQTDFITTFRNIHKPVGQHHLEEDDIRRSILEARVEGLSVSDFSRYILWVVWIVVAGMVLKRKTKIHRIRRIWLIVTLTIFGIILGAAPNPMESIVKAHKLVRGIPGNPVVSVALSFVIFTLLSLFGAKMICSWG